ncbi:hypothetical protein BJV78DRAFT_65768 [Lactifluus subvellereus]|nr:hypothetical protein BJV78DRAFT_65768 [Lactifluus subvellereus]
MPQRPSHLGAPPSLLPPHTPLASTTSPFASLISLSLLDYLTVPPRAPFRPLRLGQLRASCSICSRLVWYVSFIFLSLSVYRLQQRTVTRMIY